MIAHQVAMPVASLLLDVVLGIPEIRAVLRPEERAELGRPRAYEAVLPRIGHVVRIYAVFANPLVISPGTFTVWAVPE